MENNCPSVLFFQPLVHQYMNENRYTDHQSFSFASEVRKSNFKNLMANLDIASLFINILLEETIDNTNSYLFLTADKVHNFKREEFKQLLPFAAYKFFSILDGECYTQIACVAMGFPLSPTLDNPFCFISRTNDFQNVL